MHEHLQRLTPLRFIAALFVVLFHFGQNVPPFNGEWLRTIVASGNNAVSFFYCLSGFIMATVYRTPMDWTEKKEYWLARFARIYPVYLFCLVVSALWVFGWTPAQLVLSTLLLQSWVPGYPLTINAPGWSLSVEALFYAVFPFVAGSMTRGNLRKTAIAVVALWVVTQFLTFYMLKYHYGGYPSRSHDLIYYFPMMHLDEFLLGAVAGAAHHFKKPGRAPIILFCIGAVVSVWAARTIAPLAGLLVTSANGLYAPLFLAGIWLVASLPRHRLLDHPAAVALGEASYSLYLLQMPVMVGLAPRIRAAWSMSDTANFYSCLALLVAASLAVYFCIERPMRKLIKKASMTAIKPYAQ